MAEPYSPATKSYESWPLRHGKVTGAATFRETSIPGAPGTTKDETEARNGYSQ